MTLNDNKSNLEILNDTLKRLPLIEEGINNAFLQLLWYWVTFKVCPCGATYEQPKHVTKCSVGLALHKANQQ